MNLPAFRVFTLSPPPTVAREARFDFTVGGCLAFRDDFVILFGPQVIANPLCRAVFFNGWGIATRLLFLEDGNLMRCGLAGSQRGPLRHRCHKWRIVCQGCHHFAGIYCLRSTYVTIR